MFFDRFQQLCQNKGVSVYRACTDIGLNRSAVNKWKQGGQPNGTTLARFAEYFEVSLDLLLGRKELQATETVDPDATDRSKETDMSAQLEQLLSLLGSEERLTFNGKPMSSEAKSSLLTAIRLGMQAAGLEYSSSAK